MGHYFLDDSIHKYANMNIRKLETFILSMRFNSFFSFSYDKIDTNYNIQGTQKLPQIIYCKSRNLPNPNTDTQNYSTDLR